MAYNILVVDDSETVRAVIVKTLGLAGVDTGAIHQARNGKEALELLKSEWIDLVFTDINMPEMSGVELVEQMQQDEMLDKVPVVVISTEGSKTRMDELMNKGVRAYIRKPFTPEGLKEVVDNLLGGAA